MRIRQENRHKASSWRLCNFLLAALTLLAVHSVDAATYTVTSKSLTGPGSFLEAIDKANDNPGPDIIEFTDNLQVDAATTDKSAFMANITESVVIDGKGGALNGKQSWVTRGGILNSLGNCPKSGNKEAPFLILALMPGFIEVGNRGQDNSDVEVTVKNLTIQQFNRVAEVQNKALLTLENFKAVDTWNTRRCAGESLIASNGGSLTIKQSVFERSENWRSSGEGTSVVGGGGDLTIEDSIFRDLAYGKQWAVSWDGETGSEVNIVSSRFRDAGAVVVFGASVANIVNSVWVNSATGKPEFTDRFWNSSSGDMNIVASSFVWNSPECDGVCRDQGWKSLIERRGVGKINLKESAFGFNYSEVTTGATYLPILGDSGVDGFTADQYTWIQPTPVQDAGALKTITNQPSLRTDLPAFNSPVYPQLIAGDNNDVEIATPAFPGELIDVIPGGTPLINPIDGSPIAFDVIGNPRVDANGERDIGALQLGLAPILSLAGTGDGSVELNWNEPLHHEGLSILKYEIEYSESGSPTSTTITVDPPALGKTVDGLTNGTEYSFEVRAIYDAGSSGEEPGPFSNEVTATPYGVLGTPAVTAVAGDQQVDLSWTLPDLGGRTFEAFNIMWREAGTTDYTDALAFYNPGTTTTTITGLKNGTTYEFALQVSASGEVSEKGLATATPVKLGTQKDSDKDGLKDDDEVNIHNTDPFNPDTDGDGLSDGDEVKTYKTDPNKPDTDGDGSLDREELIAGTDPLDPASYSTNDVMLRDEAAGWLGRFVQGYSHTPPTYTDIYGDVADGAYNADWIEQIYNDMITQGCNSANTLYCPKDPVTKTQAVKLILRAEHGGSYSPPIATSAPYADVASHPDIDWIAQAKTEGITTGCGDGSNFCPDEVLTQRGFLKMLGGASF